MNKLTALYSVMRQMKALKESEGVKAQMEGELIFGEKRIAEGHMTVNKANGKMDRNVSIKLGEEEIKFEHNGHRPGHYHHHHHHDQQPQDHSFEVGGKRHHGHRHGGGFTKAMYMIKLLDLMTYETLSEERSVLALSLKPADLPEELRTKMEKHLNCKKEMLKVQGLRGHEHYGEWLKSSGLETLNTDSLEPVAVNFKLTIDADANPVAFEAEHLWQSSTQEGDVKPIHFKFSGKLV